MHNFPVFVKKWETLHEKFKELRNHILWQKSNPQLFLENFIFFDNISLHKALKCLVEFHIPSQLVDPEEVISIAKFA